MEGVVGSVDDPGHVETFRLQSAAGVHVSVSSFGAIITSIRAPDRHGVPGEIALGHDRLEPYLTQTAYLGALVGRYANRIANGRFVLDGRPIQLTRNNGAHHLHGGARGFDKHLWDGERIATDGGEGVRLHRVSPDGEEHYPGALDVTIEYLLSSRGELLITYDAVTSAPTIVNLTQHTYFNLSGSGDAIDDHVVTLHASRFTPVDEQLIPTGECLPVDGTPFDFRRPRRIGDALQHDHPQLRFAGGFDHNFVLDAATGTGADRIHGAHVVEPSSGRALDVFTTEPGIQFYSGNFLDGSIHGRHGVYRRRAGFCLETQRFPDTPNQPAFGSAVLRPGERYRSSTIYAFSIAA